MAAGPLCSVPEILLLEEGVFPAEADGTGGLLNAGTGGAGGIDG